MYIDESTVKTNTGKTYTRYLIRHSYRENGKIRKKTIANISHCSPEEIEAIKLALKNKKDLSCIKSLDSIKLKQGASFGAVYVLRMFVAVFEQNSQT
jgi:hypothetical protein